MARRFAPPVYAGLKTAFRLLVEDVGGLEAAACVTRAGRSQLAAYYAPSHELFPPADVIADLESVAGAPRVTEALARAAGFHLVAPPASAPMGLGAATAALGQHTALVFGEVSAALADGRITPAEAEGIRRQVDAARRALDQVAGSVAGII